MVQNMKRIYAQDKKHPNGFAFFREVTISNLQLEQAKENLIIKQNSIYLWKNQSPYYNLA